MTTALTTPDTTAGPALPLPATMAHLDALLARVPYGYGLVISGKPRPKGARFRRWVPFLVTADRVDEAAAIIEGLGADKHVYMSMAAMAPDKYAEVAAKGTGPRGGADDMGALFCVWSDLDVEKPGHHASNNDGLPKPPTLAAAMGILDGLPTPTMVTDSGGGLHAYWLFTSPLELTTDEARTTAEALADGWVRMIADIALDRHGWGIDRGVGDLARVLRVAGSHNPKTDERPPVRFYATADPLPGIGQHRPWKPATTYKWQELAAIVAAHTPPPPPAAPVPADAPEAPATASTTRPARTHDTGKGPGVLDAVAVLPWDDIWPQGWTYTGQETVKGGQTVELWQRPTNDEGTSPTSAKCWPDGGCHVWSDNVPGLPSGDYSKANIYAWRFGFGYDTKGLSDLSRALISAARGTR